MWRSYRLSYGWCWDETTRHWKTNAQSCSYGSRFFPDQRSADWSKTRWRILCTASLRLWCECEYRQSTTICFRLSWSQTDENFLSDAPISEIWSWMQIYQKICPRTWKHPSWQNSWSSQIRSLCLRICQTYHWSLRMVKESQRNV